MAGFPVPEARSSVRGRSRRSWLWLGTAACLAALLAAGLLASRTPVKAAPGPADAVVRLIGVGSVLTADGTIWQYRPDRARWQTIDESFHDQGKETHILPLPVPPSSIREMVTFGFILTDSGECWLYDLDKDRWQKLSAPGSGR